MRATLLFVFSSISFCLFSQPKQKQANWQQKTDYNISVKLNDEQNKLSAFEKITYTNNSPNELNEIYIHLWPNAYRNIETAFAKQKLENGDAEFYYSTEEDKGWIDSLDFKINGQRAKWYLTKDIDICKIELLQPLKSGEKLEITTPFSVKIPKVFSRMGHEGQMYCITQWYPKPAVYDANGWNAIPYLDEGEFYSEFGKFEVSISVPQNYVVAATGNLQNDEEKVWLKERTNIKAEENNSTDTIKNFQRFASSKEFKTLRFVQDSIHDFAWFCDKRFLIEQSSVVLKSGKKVNTFLYHVDPSQNSVKWIDSAIYFYSKQLGEYPYDNASAVVTKLKAGAGMEYPTITNVDAAEEGVIVHEVGHNWFYGILANNERTYPWMDESFNNYYETRFEYKQKIPARHRGFHFNKSGDKNQRFGFGETPFGLLQQNYLFSARKNNDQPVNIPAPDFEEMNYGTIVYGKAPLMFHQLQDYLGDSLFDAMMQSYYEKWKFKHPLPEDFFDHAKSFTGKNLDWFNQLYSTTIKPDYKIVSARKGEIVIKNKSSIASPFPVSAMKNDSVFSTKWFEGFTGKKTVLFTEKLNDKFRIDAYETTLDIYRNNNTIRTRGIFKKMEPISFQLLGNLENPYKTQIFYSPIVGANLYNKTMIGMAFYNSLIPQKKFEYAIAPMYSFGTNDVVGYANFEKHFNTDGIFKQVHVGVNGARFGYNYFNAFTNFSPFPTFAFTYNKIEPTLCFDLNKENKRSVIEQSIQFRSTFILFSKNANSNNDPIYPPSFTVPANYRVDELSYFMNNKKAINKNALKVTLQNINDNVDLVKIFAEFKQTINYEKPKKKLDMRIFGGMFLTQSASLPTNYYFLMCGNSGYFDYMFDHSLLGRSEVDGLFSHQLIEQGGNMHIPIDVAYIVNTDSWLFSANLVTTIPGPIPVRLFVDVGYINAKSSITTITGTTNTYTPTFQYVAGAKIVVVEDVFEINLPLFNSDDIESKFGLLYGGYKEENSLQHLSHKITFTLNLNKLNPLKAIRTAAIN